VNHQAGWKTRPPFRNLASTSYPVALNVVRAGVENVLQRPPQNAMRAHDSPLARFLEPFVSGLWILFVLVSLLAGAIWTFGIGEGSLERLVTNPGLRATLVWLLAQVDFAWITLAAANVYLSLATCFGIATARRWALIILSAVMVAAWLSVFTGFPLGRIRYGTALGPKLGSVPVGLPLFWFSVIVSAREAVLRVRSRCGQRPLAASVGLIAMLTDLNLEPLAVKYRGFWFWTAPTPDLPPGFDFPFTGSLAWGVLAAVLTLGLRELEVADSAQKSPWPPIITLAIFEVVFLASHVTHRLSY